MAFSRNEESGSAGFFKNSIEESDHKLLLFPGKFPDLLDAADELG